MRLGALLGPITEVSDAKWLANQAVAFVESGFSSLWMAQAIGRGFFMSDPLLALSVAATVTEDVELGTAVLQLPLYQTMDLAHRLFSLQQICGNQLILGVGAGSTVQDFVAFGRDNAKRFEQFDSGLSDLRQVLEQGHLQDVDLSPWPEVLNQLPVFFGTWGKGVVRAAHEFDGWIASGHYRSVDQVCASLQRYRAAGGGRAIVSTLQVSAKTDLGELADKLKQFAHAGFDDAVLMQLPGGPTPQRLRRLLD